jgi:DNA polymerase-3 subunit delta
MYKKELDILIQNSALPKSLLLYGEEFYTSYYIKKILPTITIKDNILSFYYDEYDFSGAKNFISQPSLFGDINLLYIKSDKKIAKKELDELVDICYKNQNSFFYFEFIGEDKVAKDLTKSFGKKKLADFVRFFKPTIGESISILANRAKELMLDIDTSVLRELLTVQNEELSLCFNDLEKLALLEKKVTTYDIREHIYGIGEVVLDDFIVKLLKKGDIKKDLEIILEAGGIDEIKVINAITNYIEMLLEFHLYIKANGIYDTKEILGYSLPPFLAKERANLSIKITPLQYELMLKELLKCEFLLKNEKNLKKNSLLYATLIKLQTFL